MENHIEKYQITQGRNIYILTSEIIDDSLRITCVEVNKENPPVFIGDFTLDSLRELNPLFNEILTIDEAQKTINNIIEMNKIKIDNQGNIINVLLFLTSQGQNIQIQPLILKPQYEIIYSPRRYLPTKKVYLPPVTIRRPTIYLQEENSMPQTIRYQTPTRKIEKVTLPLSPKSSTRVTPIESPLREKINVIPTSPNGSHLNITRNEQYSNIPMEINNNYNNEKIILLENERNQLRTENKILNNEIISLKNEIISLKKEIMSLRNENEILKQNKNNELKEKEIIFLKRENERLNDELKKVKIEHNNDFENYKRIKEEEINEYKKQIDDLVPKINFLIQENNDLKIKLQNYNNSLAIVRGEIIKKNGEEELEMISRGICNNHKKINFTLIYKATVDSDKAEIFHKKCDKAKSSVVLVKTKDGKRFGGYTSCDWVGNGIDKKDDNAFVFSLDKMKIYNIINGEDAIGCYPNYGPVFLGCQIRIYDNFFERGGTTFLKGCNYNTEEDYELTGGEREFQIIEVEVYSIELE